MPRRRVGRGKGRGAGIGMPVSAWPATDRRAWERAKLGESDDLDASEDAVWMADNTQAGVATAYARWLAWLKANQPESFALPPADRVRKDWVKPYLDSLRAELKLSTTFTYACGLRSMLGVITPGIDRPWFDKLIDKLERLLYRQPRPPKAVVDIERLYQLGIEMMQTAGADLAQDDLAVAEQFRDGLIFAFMAMRPLRRSNMVGLHLGVELLTTRGGYRVVLPPEAYKTSVPFEFAVPDQLAPYMRLYLEVHRPVLTAGGRAKRGTSVWLNRTGRPVNGDDLRKIVRGRSEQALGIALNPHDFRHCAASSIVTVTPADWMIIKVILGHSTPRMAERHYIHAKGIAAARGYQDLVDHRREAAARRLRRAPR